MARPRRRARALRSARATIVIAALSLLGSALLSTTANGIAVFMAIGAGPHRRACSGRSARRSTPRTLDRIADVASWLLPFEALYQHGLSRLTADVEGTTAAIVNLGPFGGAQEASFAPLAVRDRLRRRGRRPRGTLSFVRPGDL